MQELISLEKLATRVDALKQDMGTLENVLQEISTKLDKLDSIDAGIKRLHSATKSGFEGLYERMDGPPNLTKALGIKTKDA